MRPASSPWQRGWSPPGEIAGDTFDFSLDRDHLHLSMTDAMGHALDAAVLASVLVGGLRNARRAGVGIAEQAERASAGLAEHTQHGEFVTGQLARIDLRSGIASIVNAGHPPPLRLRDGVVTSLELEIDPPFALSRPTLVPRPAAGVDARRQVAVRNRRDARTKRHRYRELGRSERRHASAGGCAAPDPGGARGNRRETAGRREHHVC